jgi:hypothetical protein
LLRVRKKMKDIFIDNNVAKNFFNPPSVEYKKLINWLRYYDENDVDNNSSLVVSIKLIQEYIGTCGNNQIQNNILTLIELQQRQGRITKISNDQIKEFQRVYFSKKVCKNLRSNYKDRSHIPVVLLSRRKLALCLDDYLIHDLVTFPGFQVRIEKQPEDLPYEEE